MLEQKLDQTNLILTFDQTLHLYYLEVLQKGLETL